MSIFRCQCLFLWVLELVHLLKFVLVIIQTSCLPHTHIKIMSCTTDRTQKKISFSILLKCMLIQLCCGKHWTTGNHNFLKGEALFSQDKNNTLQTGKKAFYSPSWTHWDNTRLADLLFSILSHILPLPLFTWVLFLKSHTDAFLFYFWMLFLHPLEALSASVLPCSQGDISLCDHIRVLLLWMRHSWFTRGTC